MSEDIQSPDGIQSPEDPQDPGFLILAPYRSHREILTYPDSRVVKANCGHHAWLSPQGEKHFWVLYTVCVDCAEEIIDEPGGDKRAVEGSYDAIRRHAGPEAAEQARALMKQLGIGEEGRAFRRPDASR